MSIIGMPAVTISKPVVSVGIQKPIEVRSTVSTPAVQVQSPIQVTRYVTSSWVIGEEVSGVVDGVNKLFRLSRPAPSFQVRVYLNGINLQRADFRLLNNSVIELDEAPFPNDSITADYLV